METEERTLFKEKNISSNIVAKLYRCETTYNHIPWCEIDVVENDNVIANYFIQNDLTEFYVARKYCTGEREFIEICTSLFKDEIDSIIKPFMEELQLIIDKLLNEMKEQQQIKEKYNLMEDFSNLTKEDFFILRNADSKIEHLEIEIENIIEKYHVLGIF